MEFLVSELTLGKKAFELLLEGLEAPANSRRSLRPVLPPPRLKIPPCPSLVGQGSAGLHPPSPFGRSGRPPRSLRPHREQACGLTLLLTLTDLASDLVKVDSCLQTTLLDKVSQ